MEDQNRSSLHQIKNQSLQEQILDVLRQAILNGEFKPGQTLTETDLSNRMGVSRAPVREALRILNTEGLVESIPYHGTTVRRLTKIDIEELYSMRILLETFALKRVIAMQNTDHVDRLKELYDEMVEAGKAKDLHRVNEIDRVFHDELISMSDHGLLSVMWQNVAMRVRQVMALRNERNADLTQVAHNHLPLIEAIRSGDEEKATEHLAKHIASAGDLIVDDWQGSDGASSDGKVSDE